MIYFNRITKTGDKLMTSYKDISMAKRISTQESSSTKKNLWEGEMYADLQKGTFGADAKGVGLCSYMKTEGVSGEGGRYAVFSKLDDKFNDLGIRFGTYGDANKFMKAVISAYRELWVVEVEKVGVGSGTEEIAEDVEVSEEAPF